MSVFESEVTSKARPAPVPPVLFTLKYPLESVNDWLAEPKYEALVTVRAVVEAYGKTDAMVEVATYRAAVGVPVAVRVVASIHEVSIPAVPPLVDGHVVLQSVDIQSEVAERAVLEA